jgi:hypothetical protein
LRYAARECPVTHRELRFVAVPQDRRADGLRFGSPAYERQKDIVHDLCDRLFRHGLQGHQHLVAQQVKRRGRNARRKAVRIDLAAFNAPAQHLIDAERLLPAATVPFALATSNTPEWWLVVTLVVRGLGLGAVTIPVMASAYIGLDRSEVPHASIITRTAQQIGGSFGTAALAVVLERAIAQHALAGLDGRAAAFDVAFWWSIAFYSLGRTPGVLAAQPQAVVMAAPH